MPPIHNVQKLAETLHEVGALNLDTKVGDLLKIEGVGDVDPGSLVSSGALGWDGYILIYKGKPAGLEEISRVAQRGQAAGGGGGGG